MKALLLDHDDSFTFNLRDWLRPVFQEVTVMNHRDSRKLLAGSEIQNYDVLVLSPGPKSPNDYPYTIELVKKQPAEKPIFGVCLGLQILAVAAGSEVQTYSPPKHGKTSSLQLTEQAPLVLRDLNMSFVARYHSLACENFLNQFEAWAIAADDQKPMWLHHRTKKQMGVQFHPESFLTEKPDLLIQYLNQWCHA